MLINYVCDTKIFRKEEAAKKVTWTFWVIKWVEKIKGGHFG